MESIAGTKTAQVMLQHIKGVSAGIARIISKLSIGKKPGRIRCRFVLGKEEVSR